ncbi:HTH-type transcriptional activator IlvY [Pseudoalteromonas denitrificans]|jgi:LysR family positive regulator for ilvC|uniref:LysR family transcriptional regulator, positive regulator for ilvC n=1 Tax=Pseudoalteromonas denitrificans DSM 6059 TaxID=1123010 RepID=A0A1I1EVN6_9GAMM|nr:HTH-type transcriptional activator IlvY [Pseudoalteromonas denitrificans]SFB91091.1 LysR family transcriptional regulator, positive regulator for ilvC [Pseudoalteromonas denitrificans DSM 6059]
MDNRSLQLFLALAETLHFGRASERCHISASTLSRNIKQLEQDLGASLFTRDNRTVTLTKQGKDFVEYAKLSLSQWNRFKSSLDENHTELQGELSLYCSVTASYSFLYRLLETFRQQHQKIEIKLNTGDPGIAITRILDGHEDMAIAAKPDQLPANIAFCTTGTSALQFIAPKMQCDISQEINLLGQDVKWQSLPYIVPEQGLNRKRLEHWWKKNHIKPQIYTQVAGNEAIVSMVSLGFGIALVPKIVLDNSPLKDKVQVLQVPHQPKAFEIGLCVQRKQLQNPIIQAMWKISKTLKSV